MNTIAVYVQNKLLLSGIISALAAKKPTTAIEIVPEIGSCVSVCRSSSANVFLAELRDYSPLSLDNWLARAEKIKHAVPMCKIVLVVDEESFPESASFASLAFKNEQIDMFLYSSSGLNYLVDIVLSL